MVAWSAAGRGLRSGDHTHKSQRPDLAVEPKRGWCCLSRLYAVRFRPMMRRAYREFRACDRLRDVRMRIELHSLDFAGDAFEVKEHRGQLVGEVGGGVLFFHGSSFRLEFVGLTAKTLPAAA